MITAITEPDRIHAARRPNLPLTGDLLISNSAPL